MYLIIFEDNEISKTDTITEDDKAACDDGYMDIIDVSSLKRYSGGEWHEIEKSNSQ